MPSLPDTISILTKHRCPDCYKGRIPHNKANTLYKYSYCGTCDGTGWVEYWASLYDIRRAIALIETLEQNSK